jgi:Protein of unknown function (DUF1353)
LKTLAATLLLIAAFALHQADAQPAGVGGRYIGKVQAEFNADGRTMKLLRAFKYIDPAGIEWSAPAGAVIDGASIPQVAWSLIGGPFEGRYREASVIHDVACVEKTRPWNAVHEVFYFAMLTSGVDPLKAKVMYAAVHHFGPRWSTKNAGGISGGAIDTPAPKTLTESDFASLKATIEARDREGRAMTLSEVRSYRP